MLLLPSGVTPDASAAISYIYDAQYWCPYESRVGVFALSEGITELRLYLACPESTEHCVMRHSFTTGFETLIYGSFLDTHLRLVLRHSITAGSETPTNGSF